MNLTFLERKEQREFHSFSHGKRSTFLSIFIFCIVLYNNSINLIVHRDPLTTPPYE